MVVFNVSAIAKKPVGESRFPTDLWAGLGFSKSMPDHAIREQLRTNNVRYDGPSMPTTFENGEAEAEAEEEDRDPWRDSPYQSPSNSFNAGRRMRAMHHDARMHAPTAMTSSQVSACASPTPPASLTVSFAQNNGKKYIF